MDADEARAILPRALGRIFRLLIRPSERGDVDSYERCRALAQDAFDVLGVRYDDHVPNWARDRTRGAQGD